MHKKTWRQVHVRVFDKKLEQVWTVLHLPAAILS